MVLSKTWITLAFPGMASNTRTCRSLKAAPGGGGRHRAPPALCCFSPMLLEARAEAVNPASPYLTRPAHPVQKKASREMQGKMSLGSELLRRRVTRTGSGTLE